MPPGRAARSDGIIESMSFESRLEAIEARYDELERELSSPDVASDPANLRKLGKDFAELKEIVGPFRAFKDARLEAEEGR